MNFTKHLKKIHANSQILTQKNTNQNKQTNEEEITLPNSSCMRSAFTKAR